VPYPEEIFYLVFFKVFNIGMDDDRNQDINMNSGTREEIVLVSDRLEELEGSYKALDEKIVRLVLKGSKFKRSPKLHPFNQVSYQHYFMRMVNGNNTPEFFRYLIF